MQLAVLHALVFGVHLLIEFLDSLLVGGHGRAFLDRLLGHWDGRVGWGRLGGDWVYPLSRFTGPVSRLLHVLLNLLLEDRILGVVFR